MKNIAAGVVLVLSTTLFGQVSEAAESAAISPDQINVGQSTALQDYLAKEDASYRWRTIREGEIAGTRYVELILTSQTWRDIVWKHRLFILKPEKVATGKHAMLIIAGGKWKQRYEDPSYNDVPAKEAVLFATIAKQFASPVAVLLQVPQQPIFDGMVEDEIISYTFEKFLETGDPEWPLLLPMVKSAVRGMDAVQEYCLSQWSIPIESFTVTGASKRGWTTWLAGASDSRVTGIAPMVIDVLNMRRQIDHQQEAWGGLSEQIHDYSERNIPQTMKTEAGEKLLQIVDPLAYRDSLTLPKLIILGTNDRYWTLDALNLYWSELVGPKCVLYVPNNGHGLIDYPRILGAVSALHEQAQGGDKLPNLSWSFSETSSEVTLSIQSDSPPTECQIWKTKSKTRDFRDSHWIASEVTRSGKTYRIQVDIPKSGNVAFFGEVRYDRKHLPLYLSTNVRIVPSARVTAPHQ